MWRFPALVILVGVGIWGIVTVFGSALTRRKQRKKIISALDKARLQRDKVWKEADSVRDMVALYMAMVVKHGPDSDEAKAFRFGADSKLMKELHGDHEGMRVFEQQADIIDETCRLRRRSA